MKKGKNEGRKKTGRTLKIMYIQKIGRSRRTNRSSKDKTRRLVHSRSSGWFWHVPRMNFWCCEMGFFVAHFQTHPQSLILLVTQFHRMTYQKNFHKIICNHMNNHIKSHEIPMKSREIHCLPSLMDNLYRTPTVKPSVRRRFAALLKSWNFSSSEVLWAWDKVVNPKRGMD